MKNIVALVGAIAAASCVSVDTDPQEEVSTLGAGPIVEFDPSNSIVPFPNNLLLDRATGKVNVPAQCLESPLAGGLRQTVINALDGFGTFKSAIRFTLSEPVDFASLVGMCPQGPTGGVCLESCGCKIVMHRRATGATPVDPTTAVTVPLAILPAGTTARFNNADCDAAPKPIDSITVVPRAPLAARSTYVVSVLSGVKTVAGADFGVSSTWGLVRQKDNPVTVEGGEIISERTALNPVKDKASLLGLDGLWKAHAQALGFVEAVTKKTRAEILLSWEFVTQTTTGPLDAAVAGSPAASLPKAVISGVTALRGADAVATYMDGQLVSEVGAPPGTCAAIGCASVGEVYRGTVTAPVYQDATANSITGGPPVPGAWKGDPARPTKVSDAALDVRILVPPGPPITGGWPTIVFGHGLAGNKIESFLVAPQLVRAGFAVVAIDFVAHGARAVRDRDAPALGCAGTPSPRRDLQPQCFAPFLATNLAITRDNIRQTVLDMQTVVNSLKLCTTAGACGGVIINPAKIGYLGISLGGIVGSVLTAMTPDIKAAVLNVPGVGLVDILENTESAAIRCNLVDGLIGAGIVEGARSNPPAYTTGACTTSEWKTQPGYLSFANSARWILDSADGANFNTRLAARRFLIQKVTNDLVVPNSTTDTLAALVGFTAPALADTAAPVPSPMPPSAAILATPQQNKWLQYTSTTDYTFGHGSLLTPAAASPAGVAGTTRVQTDAITYLLQNVSL